MKSYKIILFTPLRRRLLEVLEQRRPLLVLLDTGKHHLRPFDEFLRYLQQTTSESRAPINLHEVISRRRCGRAGSVERWGTDTATPSSRRRVDGVEVDAAIQDERAVNLISAQLATRRRTPR